MSFLRPTVSSLRRAVGVVQDEKNRHGGPSAAADLAQPLRPQPALHEFPPSDHSHVPSRGDAGLRSRVRMSSLTRRPTAITAPSSPSLREFADKCDSVIQRAQEVLERTREQELKVTKALEERLSQSPVRQATPPPQRELTAQQTPTKIHECLASPWSSPAMPTAPPTTPVAQTSAASSTCTDISPSLRPLPASPPTLVGLPRSPLPTQPDVGEGRCDAVQKSLSPSLLQRLRRSWQRASGQKGESHETSPAPSAVSGALCAGGARVSPRKSVRFASPDKLETVTPTKVVELWSDSDRDEEDEGDEEETSEDEEEQEWQPPAKRTHVEPSGGTLTPLRDSVVLPPAPPPSAVKSGSRSRSGTGDSSHGSGSSLVRSSPPPPTSPGQPTRSPSLTRTSWPPHHSRLSGGGSGSSGRSSTSSSRRPMDHDEVKDYVVHNTIRRSLSRISRDDMEGYLREKGVVLPTDGHFLKRFLLAQIRALIKQEMGQR